MAIWAWVVAAIIIGLMVYELIYRIKRRNSPEVEEPQAAEEAVDPVQAELVRANMKIAVLESRLVEAQFALEDAKNQYQKQVAHTEAAYQRQMVVLSERLATNNKGDWRVAVEKHKAEKNAEHYPVRMAAEVAAWKATVFSGDPTAVPLSASDPQAAQMRTPADEIAAAVAAISGLDPSEINNEIEDVPRSDGENTSESWVLVEPHDTQNNGSAGAASGESGAESEERAVDLNVWYDDRDQDVLDQITVLEDEAGEPSLESPDMDGEETADIHDYLLVVENDWENAAAEAQLEAAAGRDQEDEFEPQDVLRSAFAAALAAGTLVMVNAFEQAVDDTGGETDELASESSAAAAEADDGAADAADNGPADAYVTMDDDGQSDADGEELSYFENRWPDMREQAMRRVLARRLGSEMDADYLDDEELLRVMGIGREAPAQERLSAEAEEDIMGSDNWVTDPLEEMAKHINGESQSLSEGTQSEGPAGEEMESSVQEVADTVWEEIVYASAEAARDSNETASGDKPHAEPDLDVSEEMMDGDAAEQADETVSAAAAVESGEAVTGFAAEGDPGDAAELPERDLDEEEAAIAATVAAILSRAPEGQDAPDVDDLDPERDLAWQQLLDNGRYDDQAAEGLLEDDPLAGVPIDDTEASESPAEVGEQAVLETAVAEAVAGRQSAAERSMALPPHVWERQPVIWQAEYYDNTSLADEPIVVRQDREIDFEWREHAPVQGVQPRTFSVRWSSVLPLDEGQYRFTASAPDGMRMWLNDRLVISAWYDQSEQTYQRDYYWRGGPVEVRVEHYENGGNAKAFLTWDRIA